MRLLNVLRVGENAHDGQHSGTITICMMHCCNTPPIPAVESWVHQPCVYGASWQVQPHWCVLLHPVQVGAAHHVQGALADVARGFLAVEGWR